MTELTMGRINFAPLNRALIGFDELFNALEFRTGTSYPPYNVIKVDENNYLIELAMAAFKKSEVAVQVEGDQLSIKGAKERQEAKPQYLHNGLSTRNFAHNFTLADNMEVKSASIEDGVLKIAIQRKIPDHKKPRTIEITV